MLLLDQRKSESTPGRRAVGAERRRGLRISQNRPVKVYEPMSARYFGGQTCDVSSTGLRIELPPAMPACEGKFINIHVGLSEKGQPLANRRAMMPAKVVWIDRSLKGGRPQVMAGVEFVSSIAAHLDAA